MAMRRLFAIGPLQVRVHWGIAFCVCLVIATLVNLGLWQLGRAAEKRALQDAMQARQLEPAVALESLPPISAPLTADQQRELENLSVTFSGSYWNEASFLVAFQFLQGAPGFELVTPVLLDSGRYVLVSRGWISPGNDGQPAIPTVTGPQALIGQLHIPAATDAVTQVEGEVWPVRFRRLDIPRAAQILDQPLMPYVVRLAENQPGVMARHWPALVVSTRSNLLYALQWFGMALGVAAISLLMSTNVLALWRGRAGGSGYRRGVNSSGSG